MIKAIERASVTKKMSGMRPRYREAWTLRLEK